MKNKTRLADEWSIYIYIVFLLLETITQTFHS